MKKLIFAIVISLFSMNGFSQINIGDILQAGVDDANVLAKPYLNPWGQMLGRSLNAGWYNSAKVHKLLGFDITFTGAYTTSPSSDATFDIAKYEDKLQTYHVQSTNTIAPTVAGEMAEADRPVLRANGDPFGLTDFTMPNGSGLDYLLTPMVTVGVGLPKGIEVKGRFAPKLEIGDAGKFSLWGLGVQKDIKDYIPGLKHVPVVNLSVLAAYTDLSSTVSVATEMADNSTMSVGASAFTTRLLVGANLPLVAFYSGVGLNKSTSDFNVQGDYTLIGGESIKDPIKVSYSNSSVDFNVGMRLRLGVIGIHADYTVGDYSSITAGLGINFR